MSGLLPDVRAAFEAIAPVGAVARFRRGAWRSDGGHLQGVGVVDERTLAITTSGTAGAAVVFMIGSTKLGFEDRPVNLLRQSTQRMLHVQDLIQARLKQLRRSLQQLCQ